MDKLEQKENQKVHFRIFLDNQVDKLIFLFYFKRNHIPADHARTHFRLEIDIVLHQPKSGAEASKDEILDIGSSVFPLLSVLVNNCELMIAAIKSTRDVHGLTIKQLLKLFLFCHFTLVEIWKHETFDLGF